MTKIIIKSVKSIKNAAVWQDYKDPKAEKSLARKTLIYGFNGTGKTTLSRVFDSIRTGSLSENLPPETEFEITLSDGQSISSKALTTPLGKNLLVFNTDFVSRNFKWDEGSATPIFYLSEDSISKKAEYDAAKIAFNLAETENKNANIALEKANKDFTLCKKLIARRVCDTALSGAYRQAYDAKKIKPNYDKRKYSDLDILTNEELSAKKKLLSQNEPLAKLEPLKTVTPNLAEWSEGLKSLLKKSISSDVIKQFEAHAEALNWVGEGLEYHKKHDLKDCLFCGNEFPGTRKALLETLFNSGLKEQQAAVETALTTCQRFSQELRDLYRQMPRENDVQASERANFTSTSAALKETTKRVGLLLNFLLETIQTKQANLIEEIDVSTELETAGLSVWSDDFTKQIIAVNTILSSHNAAFESFKTLQTNAFKAIESHIHAEERDDYDLKCKNLDFSETNLKVTETVLTEKTVLKVKLENELRKQGIAANKVSDLLKSYLGHDDIQLKSVENGYQLIRGDEKPAKNLSEGEKTGLAFCFFLTQFAAEDRDTNQLIVVIDDPISSLDTAAKTHAFSLMRKMTKRCAQIIILTHNMTFMGMVKNDIKAKWNTKPEDLPSLLNLTCEGADNKSRQTTLCQMNSLLKDYNTEYHYLFNIVYKAAQDGNSEFQYLLPNATRKLLEIFLSFAAPNSSNFTESLIGENSAMKHEADLKPLERLVQIESHGTMDGIGSLPALTVEEAIKACFAAMSFIKKRDERHYNAMKNLCKKHN